MNPTSPPKITIITPSYNQGEFLEDTLRSAVEQDYPNLEHFVIDGGSTDNSVEIIKRYEKHIDWWVSEKDRGQSHAINKGLKRATGQIITWLNSDDFFHPGALDIISQAAIAHPEAGLFIGNGTIADRQGRRVRRYSKTIAWDYDILLRGANFVLQPATFIHRRVFEEQGLIDENIVYAMDLELWLRVGNKYPVVTIDEELAAFRWYEEIKTSSGGFKQWVSMWDITRRYCKDPLTPGLFVEFLKTLQDKGIQKAAGLPSLPPFASQSYWSFYQEMQKVLGTDDCIPRRNRGIVFRPRRTKISAPATTAPPPQPVVSARTHSPGRSRVVDIVLPEGHSWFVREGYAEALKRLGCLGRVLYVPSWKADDPRNRELFDYLRHPRADVIFLMDTIWHAQQVHASTDWRRRWAACPARKLLFSFESVSNPWLRPNLRWWNDNLGALQRAVSCVDGIVFAHEIDEAMFRETGLPALWQPFAVDETIAPELKDFGARKNRAFFKGKTPRFYEDERCYQVRRQLIAHLRQHAACADVIDQYACASGNVLERNRQFLGEMSEYQAVVGLPSLSPTMVVRPFEAMLAGCVFFQNRIQGERTQQLFQDNEHVIYYDENQPEELVRKIRQILGDAALGRRIAENGRREVLAKHTIRHRVTELLPWLEINLKSKAVSVAAPQRAAVNESVPAAVPAPVEIHRPAPTSRRGNKVVIDGVIFQFQQKRPAGIYRVWNAVLLELGKSDLAKDIVLLDRANTAPDIPGIQTIPAPSYDHQRFEGDPLQLQDICEREAAGLFISTYYTYPEHCHSMIMLHDMIPEILGQDLSHCEWRAKARAIEKAHAYLCVSNSTMNDFRKLHPELNHRAIFLTPNAVGEELQRASDEAIADFKSRHEIRKPYFLLVGNRTLYKNAHLFFRAFASWPRRNEFEIVCTGGGEKLEECFKPFVRGVSCHVLGLNNDELAAAYSGAVALVYPSRYEGFGLPVLEAQRCGCPVITCRNSSLPEISGDGVLFVGENDVAGLLAAFAEVLNVETSRELIEKGRQNVRRFAWSTTARTVIDAIQKVRSETASLALRTGDPLNTVERYAWALGKQGQEAAASQMLVYAGMALNRRARSLEFMARTEDNLIPVLAKTHRNLARMAGPAEECEALLCFFLALALEKNQEMRSALQMYLQALNLLDPKIHTTDYRIRLGIRVARLTLQLGNAGACEQLLTSCVLSVQPNNAEALELLTRARKPRKQAAVSVPKPAPPIRQRAAQPTRPVESPAAESSPASPRPAAAPAAAPMVSAIVSAYKSGRFLRGCLEDLETQTIADRLEIIVVDSNSPQNERAIVEEFQQRYSNIIYIRTQERETIYGAWNRGIKAAHGKYITSANTDDRHRQDALETLARALDEHPDIALVYADCLITGIENETFAATKATRRYQWLDFNAADLLQKGCFCGPQPMWRREVHDEHGWFDAGMIAAGDYEFWLRMAQTRKFLHVKEVLGLYLESPASVEHANRHIGAKESRLAQSRYRDAILSGRPPFRPTLAGPMAAVEIMIGADQKPAPAPARVSVPAVLPAVARLGQLDKARELFGRKNFAAAWSAGLAAIASRPFHPEAFLLLAQIASAVGAGPAARQCAQQARNLAPNWKAPKPFLQKNPRGTASPEWLKFPNEVQRQKSKDQSLSVCLIVKNEEKFLAQCLASVKPLASQIVLVDTGSTDHTIKIAREFGAEVHSFAWCDDFSAARNAALEHATGDWVLMLDADEELPARQHPALFEDMNRSGVIALRLPLADKDREAQGRHCVPRLFRNAPGVFYQGRIHEQVFPSLIQLGKHWELKTGVGTAQLLHHGYDPELIRDRDKIERNLKLLRQAVTECPEDANLAMNLGLELVHSGDLQAGLVHYREAFRLMSARPDGLAPELREVLLTQLTCHLHKVRAHDEIVQTLNSPLAKRGGLTASLHFALGLAHFELKQFRDAAGQIRQCLAKRRQATLSPINTDILTAAPCHCLALSLANLGDIDGAEKMFRAGLSENGRTVELKLDYAKFLAAQNRPVEALHRLHEIVQSDTRRAAAWRLGGEIALGRPEFLEFARDWTGEAIRHLPDDAVVIGQRAEALLLSQDAAGALPLWTRAVNGERPPRALAARILCATVASQPMAALQSGPEEAAVSRAFVDWYRRLVAAGARDAIVSLNSRVETLRPVLPSAAGILEGVMGQMQQAG